MQQKLQQLKNFISNNWYFLLCLSFLFFLPIYTGKIISSEHAFIFGKYINYLHVRLSVHLLLSILLVGTYVKNHFSDIRLNRSYFFGMVIFLCIALFFPLLSLSTNGLLDKPELYLSSIFHLAEYIITVIAFLLTIKEILLNELPKNKQMYLLGTIGISIVIQLLFGIGQFIEKGPIFPSLLSWTGQPLTFTSNSFVGIIEYARIYGTTPHPNILAAILVFYTLLLLATQKRSIQVLITIAIAAFIISFTMSKIAFAAFIFVLVLYLVQKEIIWKPNFGQTLLAFLTTNLLLILFFHFAKSLPIQATFITSRSIIHQLYLDLLKLHPEILLTGTGFTMSIPTLLANAANLSTSSIWKNQILAEPPHNIFILSIIEFGIPVTTLGIALFGKKTFHLLTKATPWVFWSILSLVLLFGSVDHFLLY